VVVQVGDVLDRGDDEIAILILLQKLHKQAEKEGGAVYILNGNHEVLNVSGDFRYVTQVGPATSLPGYMDHTGYHQLNRVFLPYALLLQGCHSPGMSHMDHTGCHPWNRVLSEK
jgi:hypothetical protein